MKVPTFGEHDLNEVERGRYQTLRTSLRPFRHLIEGRSVLDFGASYGLSAVVLIEMGASDVWGVEPDLARVERVNRLIADMGLAGRVTLSHLQDTRHLDCPDGSFRFILANAVLEHIPQPREEYIREIWRVLDEDGTL